MGHSLWSKGANLFESMISVFQIYFDEKTKLHLEPEFIPYFNDTKDGYFENSVIKKIHESKDTPDSEYIGISSWKQRSKTNLTGKDILSKIKNDIEKGTAKDVYLYPPVNFIKKQEGIIPEGYAYNATIKATDLWEDHRKIGYPHRDDVMLNNSGVLPFNIFDGKWIYSHCNYWIAKREVLDKYCKEVLIPAINYFERPEVKEKMLPWYNHSHENKKYNSALFTLEALFGSFLAHENYSYSYICKKKVKQELKRINILGYQRIAS